MLAHIFRLTFLLGQNNPNSWKHQNGMTILSQNNGEKYKRYCWEQKSFFNQGEESENGQKKWTSWPKSIGCKMSFCFF
jgi:hypothetical protein